MAPEFCRPDNSKAFPREDQFPVCLNNVFNLVNNGLIMNVSSRLCNIMLPVLTQLGKDFLSRSSFEGAPQTIFIRIYIIRISWSFDSISKPFCALSGNSLEIQFQYPFHINKFAEFLSSIRSAIPCVRPLNVDG